MLVATRRVQWLLALAAAVAMVALFYLSLNHPITADLAMLHYCAWLINERGFVVYRDIFELNFPAPFLFHSLLGHLVGYEALPLRFIDIALFIALARACWVILAPLSRPAAVLAPALFSFPYLMQGGEFVLERDYLALLPAVFAFALAINPPSRPALVGVLAALACSFKPNAVVAVPVLLWLCHRQKSSDSGTVVMHFLGAGLLTAAIPFAWVAQQGGLDAFLAIYRDFVPIYAGSRYDLWHYEDSSERLRHLAQGYATYGGGAMLLSLPGLLWAHRVFRDDTEQQQRIHAIGCMAFAFTLYELIAGKFWYNHMFPSIFWVCVCLSLLLCLPKRTASRTMLVMALLLAAIPATLAWTLGSHSLKQMHTAWQQERNTPEQWRARQVAQSLQELGLGEGDRVQVLDMAGDGQATLLLARATSATRHLIDVPLYMRPDLPATQSLRRELVNKLRENPPRFIVYFDEFLHPGGGNRLKEFTPLYALLQQDYDIARQAEGEYTLFRRKE